MLQLHFPDWFLLKIPSQSSRRPRQDPVKMPQSPRRDPIELFWRPRPILSTTNSNSLDQVNHLRCSFVAPKEPLGILLGTKKITPSDLHLLTCVDPTKDLCLLTDCFFSRFFQRGKEGEQVSHAWLRRHRSCDWAVSTPPQPVRLSTQGSRPARE